MKGSERNWSQEDPPGIDVSAMEGSSFNKPMTAGSKFRSCGEKPDAGGGADRESKVLKYEAASVCSFSSELVNNV